MHFRIIPKRINFTCIILIFISHSLVFASLNQTLPTWHWAYEYVSQLQNGGYCIDLSELQLPYLRGDVAQSLLNINEESIQKNSYKIYHQLYRKLQQEFKVEIDEIERDKIAKSLKLNSRVQADIDKESETEYYGVYRFGAGLDFNAHAYVYSGVKFDQYDYNDPKYFGYKWRGFAGYTEQAYLNLVWDNYQIKIGRDFIKWGVGKTGKLVMSNIARPLDQVKLSAQWKPFCFTYFIAELDPYDSDSELLIRRYLSGHRLQINLFQNRLKLAVTELLLYGGEGKSVDFTYLNPFIFYHGAHKNKHDPTNVLPTVDLLYRPKKNISLYGSLLIDDIQLEKTGPGDLEPNEIGYLIGSDWADPFKLSGLTISGEYVRIANRTYKTPSEWETFIHRNQPLGHPLGNDFDFWFVELSKWWMGNLNVKLNYQTIRKGEGSIYTPWDSPWMDYTVEEGYSEPFPTGIVEKRNILGFEFKYYPSIHWGMQGFIQFLDRENADNIEGVHENDIFWRLGFWWEGDVKIVTSD